MTEYRIKIVHLFDPDTAKDRRKDNGEFLFTKPYYLPQKFVEPIRYDWWVKLFGKKKGWWKNCAPKDVCSTYLGESYAGDGIHHFYDIEQCKDWIKMLETDFADKGKIVEFVYLQGQVNL